MSSPPGFPENIPIDELPPDPAPAPPRRPVRRPPTVPANDWVRLDADRQAQLWDNWRAYYQANATSRRRHEAIRLWNEWWNTFIRTGRTPEEWRQRDLDFIRAAERRWRSLGLHRGPLPGFPSGPIVRDPHTGMERPLRRRRRRTNRPDNLPPGGLGGRQSR